MSLKFKFSIVKPEPHISKSHQEFSRRLNDLRVLTNPEEFLGQNYKAVLNFWLILDGLTEDQRKTIYRRYWDFYTNQYSEWDKSTDEVYKAARETIGREFAINAAWGAWDVYGVTNSSAPAWATRELIGMHKILEQGNYLTFFEMFLKVL